MKTRNKISLGLIVLGGILLSYGIFYNQIETDKFFDAYGRNVDYNVNQKWGVFIIGAVFLYTGIFLYQIEDEMREMQEESEEIS